MQRYESVFAIISCFLLAVCFGELSIERKDKFLNGFVEYLNNLPDQVYSYDEGVLLNAQKADDGSECYYIEARLRANSIHNLESSKYLKCSATIQDLEENGVSLQENQYHCEDVDHVTQSSVSDDDTLEEVVINEQTTRATVHQPVHLDNEVQQNTGATSGEEFIAVRRQTHGGTCVGCASHVNPQAPGVSHLTELAIKHLDRHEPNTKHSLLSVLDVERQVQVVNGVRYTLKLQVGFNNCTSTTSDPCFDSKVCMISILEKPWLKLPDGSKHRAILSNNCTDEWIFGDEGEYIPNNEGNTETNDINVNSPTYIHDKVDDTPKPIPDYDKIANTGSVDEILKAIHNTDLQVEKQTDKSLTEKTLKELEEQIISHDKIYKAPSSDFPHVPQSTEADVKLHRISDFQTLNMNTDQSIPYKQSEYEGRSVLNEDRKKAIDDLINFFNSAGFDSVHEDFPRVKRSYEHELKVMSVAEKIHKIKKNINKAKYIYTLAQNMVDYLNEVDFEIKTRVLQDVIGAEKEFENFQNFFYIQIRVIIPCDKTNCEEKDIQIKICNGVIETTDRERPQILSAFCYDEQKNKPKLSKTELVELNDPVLLKLIKESLKKIELESTYPNAMKIEKILQAYTTRVSGTITKIIVSLSYSECNKTVSYIKRTNCTIVQSMGSNMCEITVHGKHWLKEKIITYTCSQRPIDQRFTNKKKNYKVEGTIKDKKILDMTQEALHYLELNSNKNNKQKVIEIISVSTQLIGGLLTEIKFIVGYTACPNDLEVDLKYCKLLDDEPLRNCKTQVWDRPWLEDGLQINVNCDDLSSKEFLSKNINNFLSTENQQKFIESNTKPNPKKVKDDTETENTLKNNKEETDDIRRKRSLKGNKVKQDPSRAEFKLLAQDSLQKYQNRHLNETSNYEVTKVDKVVKQLVSGAKYDIDFVAKPIQCIEYEQNKTKCDHNNTLYCHSFIWERPWKGPNKINVKCNRYVSDENNEKTRNKRNLGALVKKDVNAENFRSLAEQSLAKYQQLTNTKYIHKVIKIHHVSHQAGTLTKIDFSISPTKCLMENFPVSVEHCNLQAPKTVLRCRAQIRELPMVKFDKDISIDCKKQQSKKSKSGEKSEIINKRRSKRQVSPVEDNFDEDVKYYYADRAIQHINDKADTNNIQKLITIHAIQNVINMGVNTVRMYIETAYTYCIRHQDHIEPAQCDELSGLNHRLCYVRLWPSPDDELVIESMAVVCDDELDFTSITGMSILDLIKASLKDLEASPKRKYKLVHQGEPNIIPSLDPRIPILLSFVVVSTNCSKYIDIDKNPFSCFVDTSQLPKLCTSSIWLAPNSKKFKKIKTSCNQPPRQFRSKRSVSLYSTNITSDEKIIQNFVRESLEKLEISSLHKYKQRVIQINSYNTTIIKGRLTTIDFDVGYTACLKYEWVDNITQCEFIEHLPRRHCKSQIQERLWLDNGKKIDVNCEDDDIPLESTVEFESAEITKQLAAEVLKHIEAKYPHPRKQKVVRIFSLDKQVIAGVHYRMKLEVGYTDCLALSIKNDCKLVNDIGLNKFCKANIWLRPWTEHAPTYRVSCDYQDGTTNEIFHKIQTEHLFSDFLTTYKPDYINDHLELLKRFEIFQNNVKKIHDLNTHERGTAAYAITRFSDLTYEEFGQKYLGLKPNLRDHNQIPMRKAHIPEVHLPNGFDWRHYNTVTEVKDQGSCGSCWAFSVTGNIEGQWRMHTGDLVSLSEQELVDCDKLDEGCNGGLPDNAYRAIEQLGGLETEKDYPYEGENDKCAFNKTLSRVQISGAVNISSNETDMAKWLVQNGPISIGINANAMQFYVGGVSHPWRLLCNPTNLDHGVLIVGYGIKDYPLFHKRLPYWIIKNSWGKGWGEQGYYRVYRGDGTCGVNQMASSAVI